EPTGRCVSWGRRRTTRSGEPCACGRPARSAPREQQHAAVSTGHATVADLPEERQYAPVRLRPDHDPTRTQLIRIVACRARGRGANFWCALAGDLSHQESTVE